MKLGLEGRTALVMAGSQGIGLASAQAFHAVGANVAICARSQGPLDAAAASMPGCLAMTADVTDEGNIGAFVEAAREKFGAVDILVNNAGGPPPGLFADLKDDDWAKAVELTLMSAIRATRAVLPGMQERGWGRIVNISSFGVKQPVPNLTLSNSIRMAVLGWAKTLSNQVGPDGITVNTVCPGWTRTARVEKLFAQQSADTGKSEDEIETALVQGIPLRRAGEAEEIANCVVFLGSDAASYITGSAIAVDGGVAQGYA
ncbi:SDR family oxidoreductase [Paraurantiacibacter namhicola]|uniref:3-oxoacyl-[acyl-carrier-protein] reductase FabG n=1 Tax=Paraurantiacibacter namhicola TaxID=645517 RepID=A0A1C7DAA4_9SPHN|nr:SDR family oxidoreductase [Paraurantiacibacter namhicola]ANU08420.1 3-oxoacyl-[acyl-carrier-protein] reductase FabG [Paraurantiacibacter namhicola]